MALEATVRAAGQSIKDHYILTKGRDDWGPWTMAVARDGAPHVKCWCCNKPVAVILSYYQLRLPTGIGVGATILKRTRRPIGVSCGCWSRFTRQVVHIAESALRKGYSV